MLSSGSEAKLTQLEHKHHPSLCYTGVAKHYVLEVQDSYYLFGINEDSYVTIILKI